MKNKKHLDPAQVTKLGQQLLLYGRTKGVNLRQVDSETYLISLGDAGVNWTDEINIKDISLWIQETED